MFLMQENLVRDISGNSKLIYLMRFSSAPVLNSDNIVVPHYTFSDIIFHVVYNIAVCECKRAAKSQKSKCTINEAIVS